MKDNKETLELINNDLLGFMNKASASAGKVFSEDYKDEELKYITPEPPYKGDLGFKNHYIPIKDMAQPILDMFINDYQRKYKNTVNIEDYPYIVLMYRKDGYLHDWVFASKNKQEIEMDYLNEKLNDFGCEYELKSGFYGSYLIYIKDKKVKESAEFIDFEGNLIVDFIKKFNSDYSLFFTYKQALLKEFQEDECWSGYLVD